jgi:membrane protein DedA with SNARE-associated domain
MSRLPWQKFVFWNALASFVWAVAFTGFGFLFGDVIAHMHHKTAVVEESVRQIMLTVLGLFLLIIAFRMLVVWYQNRERKPK